MSVSPFQVVIQPGCRLGLGGLLFLLSMSMVFLEENPHARNVLDAHLHIFDFVMTSLASQVEVIHVSLQRSYILRIV